MFKTYPFATTALIFFGIFSFFNIISLKNNDEKTESKSLPSYILMNNKSVEFFTREEANAIHKVETTDSIKVIVIYDNKFYYLEDYNKKYGQDFHFIINE